jgi:hypothetical protein
VEVLGDTADGVTTLDGEESLCRRVVENLVHLVVTTNPVTVKRFTRDLITDHIGYTLFDGLG